MSFRIALTTVAAALALAAPAQADDASVIAAYNDTLPTERAAANAEYTAAFEDAQERPTTNSEVERVLAADKVINDLAAQVVAAVTAQEPSTENGTKAKTATLRQFATIIRVNDLEMRGARLWIQGKDKQARRYLAKSDRLYFRTYKRQYRQMKRAWKRAGFTVREF
jgi:hypothetical protein